MKTKHNKNTHYKVKNLAGTSGLRCKCGTWIKHWFNHTKSKRTLCAVIGCNKEARVGAHVHLTDRRMGAQWWIVPFCYSHNHHSKKEEVYLKPEIELIAANKKYSCNS